MSVRTATPRIVYVYLAIIVVSWAGNWPLMKLALADAPPLVFVLLRLIGTLILLAPVLGAIPTLSARARGTLLAPSSWRAAAERA